MMNKEMYIKHCYKLAVNAGKKDMILLAQH